MESEKRRRRSEGEIEEERYLCMGSKYNLFCIDLKKTEEKYGPSCSEFSRNPPMAEVVWATQTHTKGIPMGMVSTRFDFKVKSTAGVLVPCSTTSASDILLIGGEVQDPKQPLQSLYASKEIYKVTPELSSPTKGEVVSLRIEPADARIPRMKSGKACPVVEEIGGNLYVLHSSFVHLSGHALPDIPFEVFDATMGQWRTLPTPPFVASRTGTIVYAHTVFGHCLVVETSRECFSFDTITEQWSCSETMTSFLPNRLPMIVPTALPPFGIDQQGKQLFVGISLMVEPAAYLAKPEDGSLLAMQSLHQVIFAGMLPEPLRPVTDCQLIPLNSYHDNVIRMCACAVIYVPEPQCINAFAVSFFSARISPSSQQTIRQMISGELPDLDDHPAYSSFLDVQVERKFFLRVDNIDYFLTGPAFFL